jgi:uncharacterized protein YkwD
MRSHLHGIGEFITRGSVALAVALALAIAPATANAAGPVEEAFLQLLNAERAAAGRPALVMQPAMYQLASAWSNEQAADRQLSHRPMSSQIAWIESRVTSDWERIGENVAYGSTVDSVHETLMASPAHRDNALGDFTHVGIGSARDAAGRVWVTFNFLKAGKLVDRPQISRDLPGPFAEAGLAIATSGQ